MMRKRQRERKGKESGTVSGEVSTNGREREGEVATVEITTDYPLFSVWRYTTTDYLLCSFLSGDYMHN
jgi:hypothetical protein